MKRGNVLKRLVAFFAAMLIMLSASFCALALDEDYAFNVYEWSSLSGAQTELINEGGINGYIKHYVDEDNRTVYVNLNICANAYKANENVVYVTVYAQNSARSVSFSFDENGISGSSTDFKLVQKFSQATEYGQEITFAFQFKNRADFADNQLSLQITVNGVDYDVFSKTVSLTPASTTKATTQKPQKTTKPATTKAAKPDKTTKPEKVAGTTKFTPPADADYFTEKASTSAGEIGTSTYRAQSFVEVPEPEVQKSLSNSAKIILACAAGLALVGAGLIVKAAVSAKNKKSAKPTEVKNSKIDEQSKEIIDRYINDDYDLDE